MQNITNVITHVVYGGCDSMCGHSSLTPTSKPYMLRKNTKRNICKNDVS